MTTEIQQHESVPPHPPDEGYWASLLQEEEKTDDDESSQHHNGSEDNIFIDSNHHQMAQQNNYGGEPVDWEQIQEIFTSDTTIELSIIGHNRGGLLVEWNSLHGFIPASQLIDFPTTENHDRHKELAERVGQTIKLRIIELDCVQNRLILSERAAQVQPGTRATVLTTLNEGDICTGRVTNLCVFGVFVDLGGIEGLIHISELSWGRVGHPSDILNLGDTIQVYIMHVDQEQGRVALSLKRLHPDPWQSVEERYHVGEIVEGIITNVVEFGAFTCIEEGLEGLIHVSELAEGNFLHPRNVVQEGDTVQARILNIDGKNRRIGLSLRR